MCWVIRKRKKMTNDILSDFLNSNVHEIPLSYMDNALLCAELSGRETKMSNEIFSDFFSLNVPEIDPLSLSHIWTMFNFVEIYRFDWQLSKISLRYLFSFTQPPPPPSSLGGRGLRSGSRVSVNYSRTQLYRTSAITNPCYIESFSFPLALIWLAFINKDIAGFDCIIKSARADQHSKGLRSWYTRWAKKECNMFNKL